MKMIDNWQQLWFKLTSVQLALVAAVLDGIALAVNMTGELAPWGWRLGLGLLAISLTLASTAARLVVQENVRRLDALLTAQKGWVDRGEG